MSVSLAFGWLVCSSFACSDTDGRDGGSGGMGTSAAANGGSSAVAGSGPAQSGNGGVGSSGAGAGAPKGGVSGAASAGSGGATTAGSSGAATAGSGGAATAGSGGAATAGSGGAMTAGSSGAAGSGGGVTTCSNIADYGVVDATIVVEGGDTYDGQCKRYRAGSGLGDGSQSEDQKPVFVLESGARIRNVVLGSPAADGIHTKGDVTLENITWEDIGEDALTIKESGTVALNGGSAKNGDDKVFQINAASTFRVSNFKASDAGKFIRQNGDTTFKVAVFIDRCDISNMNESIFRTDSSTSTVSMTNTRYHGIGDALFIGVAAGNITQSGNTEY